jgi:hypothetical protein
MTGTAAEIFMTGTAGIITESVMNITMIVVIIADSGGAATNFKGGIP